MNYWGSSLYGEFNQALEDMYNCNHFFKNLFKCIVFVFAGDSREESKTCCLSRKEEKKYLSCLLFS